MTKIDLVRKEMMAALKAGNAQRKEALSLLLAALKSKQIDKRSELTEDEENAVVFKEIKSAQEAIDTAPATRTDIVNENKFKIDVYSEFAPKLMDEGEIKDVVQSVLQQLGIEKPTPQDKGRIMKTLMPLVKGKADGKLVNKVLEEAMK
jgi:uncharacterized protein YqeY